MHMYWSPLRPPASPVQPSTPQVFHVPTTVSFVYLPDKGACGVYACSRWHVECDGLQGPWVVGAGWAAG